MSTSMKLSSTSVETFRDVGHFIGPERSSGRSKIADGVGEKTPSPWIDKAILFQGKHRVRHSFSQPYLDRGFESIENASPEKVQSRSSGNERKPQLGGRACDDNELIKHMSNLPGFLQQVKMEKTIQGKALSFGVLDWTRLEKWQYTERMPGRLSKKTSPSGDSFVSASGLPKISPNLRKQPSSHLGYPSLSYSTKQRAANHSHFRSPQLNRMSSKEGSGSYLKEEEYVECLKSNGNETWNQKYQSAESIKIGRQKNHLQRMDTRTNGYKSERNPQKEMISVSEASSSSKLGKHTIALLSPNKVSAQGKQSEMRSDEVKLTSDCSPADPQNIELLLPSDVQETSCSGGSQITQARAALDIQLPTGTQNRYSDFCTPRELYSGEHIFYIPYNLSASRANNADIIPDADSITPTSSEAKSSDMSEETSRPSIFVEDSNRKEAGSVEQPAIEGRFPSPTRRFSFNLGRMGRSFSFKESSAVPQLSSTYTTVKSGPVRPEFAPSMDTFERDPENSTSRSRSSPLRRLLDPLLKHKTCSDTTVKSAPVRPEFAPSMNNFERDQEDSSSRSRSSPLRRLLDPSLKHKTSGDTAQPLNGSLCSITASHTCTKGRPQGRRPETSTFQALLQLTFKNELPFFRLVVENSEDMLAAAVNMLPTSEKVDSCMIYSFYSVQEIKKKSMNWISHGSKSKSCSLGYSMIGQMKISSIYHPKVNKRDPGACDERECVLYSVNPGQREKQMLAFVPNKEIATIVVKIPHMSKNQLPVQRKFPGLVSPVTLESQGKENPKSTIVILPGAVHSIPIKGAPSSLISRWRSGGSCDCGGWDVGCKLQTLADSGEESLSSSIDHLNLFMEGAEQKSRPVFSLKPLSDELYSIELDASISLLEAFATSVANLTNRKIPETIDAKGQSGSHKKKRQSFPEQIPARYVRCPPLSPVGRI